MKARFLNWWLAALLVGGVLGVAPVRADIIDDAGALQAVYDESLLDIHGERWTPEQTQKLEAAREVFGHDLKSSEARALWTEPLPTDPKDATDAARNLGLLQGRLQHVAALEMINALKSGQLEEAKEWRSVIKLPKYANSVEGALALQRLGGETTHREEVSKLLGREYVLWQITRARERSDALLRLIQDGRATPTLVASRSSEIESLSDLPPSLLKLATGSETAHRPSEKAWADFLSASERGSADLADLASAWRLGLEGTYPNLLTPEDVQRRERIILKLLRLIPMEYQSGVRAGEITIPIEYREAKSFTIQAQQIVNELMPIWRQTQPDALKEYGPTLLKKLEDLETVISRKGPQDEVDQAVKDISSILQKQFGLSLKRPGMASDVVTEAGLEIRALLGQSLAAAQQGQWRTAEQHRVDAYVNFDLEIESRTLPRDPSLAIRAEKTFLDGSAGKPGIKAALDSRLTGDELTAAYQRALDALEECSALVKVGLSPTAAIISAVLIVAREGLEAVVILAALLAGLRGPENAGIRHRIGVGAWLAIAASVALFAVSRTLLQGLSRYGETLEAVISIIAVVILLMVTNWVFHKYYWTGWNARLRDLSKAAQRQQATRWESLALVGVGFMTIFREGFETTLFMQSLILEAGMRPVLIGLAIGGVMIGAVGFAVFSIGAKLPYRKMLVVTGFLVIFVLFTFLGSTVRLFQTVGWLSVHPVPGLEFPTWMGVWLGLYPTWEGLLVPFGTFAYVGGMWLWVKFVAQREEKRAAAAVPTPKSAVLSK